MTVKPRTEFLIRYLLRTVTQQNSSISVSVAFQFTDSQLSPSHTTSPILINKLINRVTNVPRSNASQPPIGSQYKSHRKNQQDATV